MTTKTKTFDCVEMKRQAALRIHAETKGMTIEEELAYWKQQRVEPLDKRCKSGESELPRQAGN